MSAERATFGAVRMVQSAADDPEIPLVPPGEAELPCDDGEPMETNRHRQQMTLLIQSLKYAWRDRHDFFAGGNMFVYFSEKQVRHNDFRGPDFFVVLDTTDRDRRSWVAWGEDGKLPDVVIELLSDRTRHIDRGAKMQIYSKIWHTAEYYLYDPWSHEFEGYRLVPTTGDYVRIEADEHGDLGCQRLGLRLGIRSGTYEGVETQWLRWMGTDGKLLLTPEEDLAIQRRAASAERERADAERERADAERERADERTAERRIRELEKELEPSADE